MEIYSAKDFSTRHQFANTDVFLFYLQKTRDLQLLPWDAMLTSLFSCCSQHLLSASQLGRSDTIFLGSVRGVAAMQRMHFLV